MPYKRIPKSFKPGGWLDLVGFFWCAREYEKHRVEDVCRLYEETFGRPVTVGQMKAAASNHGWKPHRRGVGKKYTDEQLGWLEDRVPIMPRSEVVALFEAEWGQKITAAAINGLSHKYGWQGAPNTGCFVSGDPRSGIHTPEQREAFLEAGKKTRFQKGHRRSVIWPMYSERVRLEGSSKTPTVFIKVPGPSPFASQKATGWNQESHWVHKRRWVWERANGPIPEGHVVLHLDGDPMNCELGNLDCVPRGVLAIMNRHGPEYSGTETNPARVRLAQLKHQISERERSMEEATNERN